MWISMCSLFLPPTAASAHHSFTPHSTAAAHSGAGCSCEADREMHCDAATLCWAQGLGAHGAVPTWSAASACSLLHLLSSTVSLRWTGAWVAFNLSLTLLHVCTFSATQILQWGCYFFFFFFWAEFSTHYLQCLSCTLWTLLVQCSLKDSQHCIK